MNVILIKIGFKVQTAVASHYHSANANAFSHLLTAYDRDKRHYIYYPVYERLLKTSLLLILFINQKQSSK